MSDPVRILQVFASLDIGGAECRMMDVYRKIDRKKIQFDFVTLSQEKQFFESEIRQLGGKVFKIINPRDKGIMKHFEELIAVMKLDNYRAVHAHTSYHSGFVLFAAAISKIKFRISHARTTGTIQKGFGTKLNIKLGKLLIYFFSNKKICISKDAGIFLFGKRAVMNNKVIVLPNAINLDEYEEFGCFDFNLKEKHKKSYIIGHIGRFSKMKNHKFLIEIFEELSKEYSPYKLLLIGEGDLKDQIESIVDKKNLRNKVTFTGNRRDIPYLLSTIDVLVLPSLYEGLGGVVIEAQASGIPCVISDTLPDEVDMNLDLITRISLDEPVEKWVSAIKKAKIRRIYDRKLIREKFTEKKYTVEQEIEFLLSKIYECKFLK